MAKHCTIHPDVEMVVVTYCPACRGGHGGKTAAKSMTAAERIKRARKAAKTRWLKKRTDGGSK